MVKSWNLVDIVYCNTDEMAKDLGNFLREKGYAVGLSTVEIQTGTHGLRVVKKLDVLNEAEELNSDFIIIPHDLYIAKEDVERMQNEGSEEFGFIEVEDKERFVLIDKAAFQPGLRIDDNTYEVVFIDK